MRHFRNARVFRHVVMRMKLFTACAIWSALLLGCGGSKPDQLVWSSADFRYYARAGDVSACSDLMTVLESHRTTIATTLGLDASTLQPVTYMKFRDQGDLESNGDCYEGIACAPRWGVESAAPFDEHELIHAYLSGSGFPPWLLVEGTAVALSCQVPLYGRPSSPSWRTSYGGSRDDPALYRDGGWLVADLLGRYGSSRLLSLYAQASHGASADDFARAFAAIYPVTLDQAWSDALGRATPPASCPWECAQPTLTDHPFAGARPVCGDTKATRTSSVAGAGPAAFVFTETAPSSLSVGSCDGSWVGPPATSLDPGLDGMTVAGLMTPGPYYLTLGAPAAGDALSFPTTASIGATCDALTPLSVPTSVVHIAAPKIPADVYFASDGPIGAIEALSSARSDATLVEICTSCARTTCALVSRGSVVPVPTGAPYVVHFVPDASEPDPVVVTIRTRLGATGP